ncbi:hypothetical protein POSPLADRAFT_1129207 [Postia placenta MAD-698-R-SB12]|uniref:E3 ubiquitin-protein ligase n=1 Tax=Postia placenta MAD-698-R-SB12 TaxID=670580 RepID=A0A1X6NI25_9APHY|nr:hypothetical protein POSPLADRAFT_1129207 [Postia placenta MAD-698-R-SB12]OSX68023.1 hypothetical protein POSPLADRAFT_1129207 [Postia placenta MAD-698-R-SB12]
MSGFSSLLQSRLLGRDRTSDPLSRLRFALETMPGSRKYVFTPTTRAEILSELYDAFWGPYAHLFLPNSNSSLPLHAMLSEATDHADHNVSFFIAQQSGGCCDCGDVEAWRMPIHCPYHPPKPETTEYLSAFALRTLQATPRATPRTILGQEIPPVRDYPYRVSVPQELHDTMSRTVAYALDFILDTLDFSPDETTPPANENDLRAQLSGDPTQRDQSRDQFSLVLWNDDKHSFEELVLLLCDLSNRTREEASVAVDRIDEQGREVIETNSNATRLLEMAQSISQIDLGATLRRAYDTFREQVVAVIIEWLLDLTRSRLATDTLILREVIAAELLNPRRHYAYMPTHDVGKVLSDINDPSRIDWMFLYHTRLWKKPRLNLKEIYASLLTLSHEHKLAVASHFASVYHRIIDAYLLVDREAETSIKYFALQLFTVPSVALYIVRQHNIVSRLLSIITAFFTNQIQEKRIVYPPDSDASIDVDSYPFKSKRFMPVFSDLRYLCHNESVQQLIAHNREYIVQFSKTCQIFMCVNPNKRAASSHVEYETDAWISVFNVTLSLSRVIKVYGEAFSRATAAELVAAITTVMHHILMVTAVADEQRDITRFPPVLFHDVNFGDTPYQVVDFDVMEGWVSFHHSLQWLLAELFKHVDILSEESLREIGLSSLRDVCLRNASEQAILTIIDYPLRVLAMIAQIRTGLWVRNGFAIRGQLMHYRDFMLRELCYDQDLFILQTALIILDPNTVLVSMLDRFQLIGYFSGATLHPVYENTHLPSMVEELLYIIITVLTETASATNMPMPAAIRREIVHALAVGPCTFTDLTKRVAERMVDDVCFERVLREVTTFKSPEATSDSGLYELKDEAYDEINPFFYHYTRNKREDVETVLRNRHKRKTGVEDPVIVPKLADFGNGPFSTIPSVFESEVLLQIIFYGIYNILILTDAQGVTPPSSEAILDQLVHLIMLAMGARPQVFSRLATYKVFEEDQTLLDVLCAFEHHDKFKAYKVRVEWILKEMTLHQPDEMRQRRRVVDTSMGDSIDPADAKKRAAKARQEAIMRQMKAQQASFVTNLEDLDADEDEDIGDTPEAPVSYGTCIVCQEELNNSKPFGSLGFLQPSRLLRRQPDGQGAYITEALSSAESLDRSSEQSSDTVFPPLEAMAKDQKARSFHNFDGFSAQYTRFGIHSSICSHMMHLECFTVYSGSIRQRHRAQATRNHPDNIHRKEFICPLCKSLGNVVLPVATTAMPTELNTLPFTDWTRAAGISILKSKADPVVDAMQLRNGSGEFVFWAAEDKYVPSYFRIPDRPADHMELHKMVDTVMVIGKNISQQSRHLRERPEPEPGERGAGMYLPEELVGYTIASLEVAQRGTGSPGCTVADGLTDSNFRMIRGLVACLTKLVGLNLWTRQDEGRDPIRHAIIKRLLPEWSRGSLTSFTYPLLLRDPFTILVETAAVAPDMLRQVLILTYYACLARTVIGMVYILNKSRIPSSTNAMQRRHEDIFGDVHMFFMSVVRHSPVFEQAGDMVFSAFGEPRIEKLLYMFTLPFLRKAAILCRAMLPSAFPSPPASNDGCEYSRLLAMLGVPPLSDLPNQDTLQTALSVWCQHYGTSHAASQLNCGVVLDYPVVYRLARLPLILDHLYLDQEKIMTCPHCKTVPMDAAICLICGATCCLQSHCCMDYENGFRGECNMHTRECAGPIGVYFCVKRCALLYLYANNGTFGQSPYLDVHGEVDVSMRRGRRQYLHHARWEEARKVWLNHGVPTLIARRLESTVDSGGWETL